MYAFRPFLTLTLALVLTLFFSPLEAQELKVLALEGQQAPGLAEGTVYQGGFRRPVISGEGYIAFKANVRDDTTLEALFFGRPRDITAIAVQNDVAPGAAGDVFCKFQTTNPDFSFIPGDDGSLVFTAFVLPPGYLAGECGTPARLGIWKYHDESITLIALEETQAADVEAGLEYKNIIDNDKHFRYRNGFIQFAAMLYDSVGEEDLGVTIWSGPTDNLNRMVTEGDEAPGLEPKTINTIGKRLAMNKNGVSLLASTLDVGSEQAFWIGTGESFSLLLEAMTPAPEYGANVSFFRFGAQFQPFEWGLNDQDVNCWSLPVFYDAEPATQYSSLWRESDGSREPLASEEWLTTDLGESYVFTLFQDCWVNTSSRVLFRANAKSDDLADTRTGLWLTSGSGDSLALDFVVSNKTSLTDESGNYQAVQTSTPSEAHINDRDNVFFEITVVKDGEAGNKLSVWMVGEEEQKLLAISGQEVNDGHGMLRTLGTTFEFGVRNVGSGNEDGRPSAVSNYDQVVLMSTLSGGLDAIMASPPCCDFLFKDGFEAISQQD